MVLLLIPVTVLHFLSSSRDFGKVVFGFMVSLFSFSSWGLLDASLLVAAKTKDLDQTITMAVTTMAEMIVIGSVVDQVIIMGIIIILLMDIGDLMIFFVGCGVCPATTTTTLVMDATWLDVLLVVLIALAQEIAVEGMIVETEQLFF